MLVLFICTAMACSSKADTNVSVNTINTTTNTIVNTSVGTAGETAPAANSTVQQNSPEALVTDLYKQHDAKKSPFFQTKNRALVDKYFTKATADMIWKDATTTNPGEVGALDFDPLYNTQDLSVKDFAIGKAQIQNDTAKIRVTYTNIKTKITIDHTLVQENGNWKIKDIDYGDNSTLVSILKANAAESGSKSDSGSKESSPTGEFEGKYQIGTTSCTVTPIKMAFEVKWEKGTGTEIFFSQDRANDKYIFASDPKTGKANVFSFDDENYNTGTFYRADGKEFPITRAK